MGRTANEEASLDESLYYGDNYFERSQLSSFTTQIFEIASAKPASLLEIGKGNGLVSDYFKRAGIRVTTVDINPALMPDICGSILELSELVEHQEYESVLCAEVLEHLPFSQFDNCLREIASIAKGRVVITLPSCRRSPIDFGLTLKLPYMKRRSFRPYFPIYRRPIAHEHHWELGSESQTKIGAVRQIMAKHFVVERVFREFLKPAHVFFILGSKST